MTTARSKLVVYASFTAAGNRTDVESVGVSKQGVSFVRKGQTTMVPWGELAPSKMQYGRGYLVLKAKDGTPRRGGPWVVNAEQGRAILSNPSWPDPKYAREVVPLWLT
jgi:hypothetical protein